MIRTDHMKLIRSIAWSFHFTTHLPFEDLYAEACLAYCDSLRLYDPTRAKISTFIYTIIRHALINYGKREECEKDVKWELRMRKQNREHTANAYVFHSERVVDYEYFGNDFPPDVQTIIEFVESSNGELSNAAPKMARGKVFQELIKRGWTHRRSWDAIRETRKLIMQTPEGCII